jgi:uncharacterized caspase-like protein
MKNCLRFLLLLGLVLSAGCVLRSARAEEAPRCFLVVAGVSDYAPDAKVKPLRFAVHDAYAVASALQSGAQNLFGAERVRLFLLTGERRPKGMAGASRMAATRANFLTALDTVRREARPQDVVLAFFAGHGVPLGPDDYAYLTQDATTADLANSPFRTDWSLSGAELRAWLQSLAARHRAVILDTCAAGAFAGDQVTKEQVPSEPVTNEQTPKELSTPAVTPVVARAAWDKTGFGAALDFPVLMGCAADAASQEAPRFGHGLLTYALLEGLRGPALKAGTLEIEPWFRQAVTRVGELASEVQGAQQPLLLWPAQGDLDFAVAHFDEASLEKLETLKPITIIVEPRLSSRDDPGGEFDREMENRVASILKEADTRGEIQLLPRGEKAAPGIVTISGLLTRENGTVRADMILRDGQQRLTWTNQSGNDDLPNLAKQIAADIIQRTTAKN